MKIIKLSNRLKTIAELAGYSKCVADVGTDHGYIPIWLLQFGRTLKVIASDINPEPLEHARVNAKETGADNNIDFVLSDGITHLNSKSADTIIIAGMGGETIVDIMSRSDWIRDGGQSFVLQPMTKTSILVGWLYKNGLYIEDARLAEDSGDIYLILLVKAGKNVYPSAAGLLVPEKLILNNDPLLRRYLDINISRIRKSVIGIKDAKILTEPERLNELQTVLNELEILWEKLYADSKRC